jgi:hypothetical protein
MSSVASNDAAPAIPAWLRGRTDAVSKQVESMSLVGPQSGRDVEIKGVGIGQRDWSGALDLIREASEAVRFSEERVNELEAEMQELAGKASEGLRRLEAELTAGERRWAKSEERARLAEARANEAEAWLARFHDAIVKSFSRAVESPGPTIEDFRDTLGT